MNDQIPSNEYYLELGSNILPETNLRLAINRLRLACEIAQISHVYKSLSEGQPGPDFLNVVARLGSGLKPSDFKTDILLAIENGLGRKRTKNKNAPRTIDLDLLMHNGQILDPNIWSRVYVAIPLADLTPHLIQPSTGLKLKEIASRLRKQFYIEEIYPFFWDEN